MNKLPPFARGRVLVVGDVMLDRYLYGEVTRISPEAPVPVVRVVRTEERPGGAANVALNIAALQGQVSLLGLVGDDTAADSLFAKLAQCSITVHVRRIANTATITKSRVIGLQQQLLRLDVEHMIANEQIDVLHAPFLAGLAQTDVVVLSDYNKGTLSGAWQWIALARKAGVPVLVDPKCRDFSLYRGATVLTPNRKEFEAVVGPYQDEHDMVQRGYALIHEFELEALLITRGSEGMTLLQRDAEPLHLPARTREVFDVTGAGDTVIGVMAAALAVGESLPQATRLANLAAGIVVTKLGVATVNQAELMQEISQDTMEHSGASGVLSQTQLQSVVRQAKLRGERVVMTNGCFDVLHAGHVAYLTEAKALGDRLIVAVNEDATVRALKGAGRPINTLKQRMAVLAGLRAVDWVVPFGELTPERLIHDIEPDVLVKGGDYANIADIAGAAHVLARGGEVKLLQFLPNCSTTLLVERIKQNDSCLDDA